MTDGYRWGNMSEDEFINGQEPADLGGLIQSAATNLGQFDRDRVGWEIFDSWAKLSERSKPWIVPTPANQCRCIRCRDKT